MAPRKTAAEKAAETAAVADLVATAEADAEQTPLTMPETPQEAATRIFADDMAKRPVIVKLARIMAELPDLKPEGRNEHFKYTFIKDTQISGALRARLARERVMIIPDVVDETWVETKTARGGTSWVTKLKIRFTAIDGDSGDEVSGHGFGYGDDSGDKGANKAFTAALKYWLLKLFQIGGEDIESDTRADERSAGRESGSAPQTAVNVEGANIQGIARGGRSEQVTATQINQIVNVVKQLQYGPEQLAAHIEKTMGTRLNLPEEGDTSEIFKTYFKGLTADGAGKLLSSLVEVKDEDGGDGIPDDTGLGYG